MNKYKKFIKYVLFAILTSVINVGAYYLCYHYIINSIIVSNIVAYSLSISVQFITNKKYVFNNDSKKHGKQLILFLLVKLISFTIDTGVLYFCNKVLHLGQLLSKIIANCSTTLSNYTLNNKMVFK